MNEKPFRNHISIIFERLGRTFWILITFLVWELVQNIKEITEDMQGMEMNPSTILWIVGGILLVLGLFLGWQLLIWSKTYISVQNHAIVIEKNTLKKEKETIGIINISNVNLEQSLFERLVRTCKVKIDTNSLSTADTTDVQILLKKKDAEAFRKRILSLMNQGQEEDAVFETMNQQENKADLEDMVRHGVYSLNFVSIMTLLICIGSACGIIADAVSQTTEEGAILNILSSILILAVFAITSLWNLISGFIKYYGFSAQRKEDTLYIQYGLIKKVQYTIPVNTINAVRFIQTFHARWKRMYRIEVINVGMGDDDEEQSLLVLYNKKEKVEAELQRLLPEYADSVEEPIQKQRAAVWVVWIPKILLWLGILGGMIWTAAQIWPKGLQWCILGGTIIITWVMGHMLAYYKTAGHRLDQHRLRIVSGGLQREILDIDLDRVQYLEFKQNVLSGMYKMQKANIHLLASTMNQTQSIPYMSEEDAERLRSAFMETTRKVRKEKLI